jgi:hypothetical protein
MNEIFKITSENFVSHKNLHKIWFSKPIALKLKHFQDSPLWYICMKIQPDRMKIGDVTAIQSVDVFVEPSWILVILQKSIFLMDAISERSETLLNKILWLALCCVKFLSKTVE